MIELLTRPRTTAPAIESPAHLAERGWNALRDGNTQQAEALFSTCLDDSPNDLGGLWDQRCLRWPKIQADAAA